MMRAQAVNPPSRRLAWTGFLTGGSRGKPARGEHFAPLPASPRFGWASRWEELAVYHCPLTSGLWPTDLWPLAY